MMAGRSWRSVVVVAVAKRETLKEVIFTAMEKAKKEKAKVKKAEREEMPGRCQHICRIHPIHRTLRIHHIHNVYHRKHAQHCRGAAKDDQCPPAVSTKLPRGR